MHGLAAFSDEITRLGGEGLRQFLKRITCTDLRGALDVVARKLALLNTGLNVIGVMLFATVLQTNSAYILATSGLMPVQQVALVHTVFNVATTITALIRLPFVWEKIDH